MNLWIVRLFVNRYNMKRPTKYLLHKYKVEYPHTTIGGKGAIARLREQDKRRRRNETNSAP